MSRQCFQGVLHHQDLWISGSNRNKQKKTYTALWQTLFQKSTVFIQLDPIQLVQAANYFWVDAF